LKNGTTSITRSDANHFSYARQLDGIDIAQIIMWGFSFSGGTAIAAVAADAGIAGLMLLRPFLDGLARLLKATKSSPALVAWILPGAMKDKLGGHTLTALTGQPGEHAAMTFPGEANGFAAAVPPDSPCLQREHIGAVSHSCGHTIAVARGGAIWSFAPDSHSRACSPVSAVPDAARQAWVGAQRFVSRHRPARVRPAQGRASAGSGLRRPPGALGGSGSGLRRKHRTDRGVRGGPRRIDERRPRWRRSTAYVGRSGTHTGSATPTRSELPMVAAAPTRLPRRVPLNRTTCGARQRIAVDRASAAGVG